MRLKVIEQSLGNYQMQFFTLVGDKPYSVRPATYEEWDLYEQLEETQKRAEAAEVDLGETKEEIRDLTRTIEELSATAINYRQQLEAKGQGDG